MPKISDTHIFPNIDQLGQQALGEYEKNAQPRFQGNDNVPIEANVGPKQLVRILQKSASGSSGVSEESKHVLEQLASDAWNIPAGIHEGGLGGAAGGADPNRHITVHARGNNYHLQLGQGSVLKKITGHGLEPAGQQPRGQSGSEQNFEQIKNTYELKSRKEAERALRYHNEEGVTVAEGARRVIANRRFNRK